MKYERLTNTNREEYNPELDFCTGCKYYGEPNGCNRPDGNCDNYDRFMEIYQKLEELEDKIENGTLKELPCKVWDDFYGIWRNKIIKHRCESIKVMSNNKIKLVTIYNWEYIFGVDAFLTRAEAEKKLLELKGEE